jgi:hypothetical protein
MMVAPIPFVETGGVDAAEKISTGDGGFAFDTDLPFPYTYGFVRDCFAL